MSMLSRIKGTFQKEQSAGEALPEIAEKASAWAGQKWSEIRNSFVMYHMNIWRSRIFYCGEFWIEIDKSTNQSTWKRSLPADDFVPQPKINRFSPAVDAICSNFNSIPEVEALPKPEDDERSMAIADIVNDLLDYCIKDNALRSDYKSDEDKAGYASQEFTLSGCVYTLVHPQDVVVGKRPKTETQPGYAFQCVACDIYESDLETPVEQCPQCGNPVETISSDRRVVVKDEQGQTVMEDIIQKKIVVRIGDPGSAFPRPGSKSMANSPYHIWAERMTLDEIWQRWGFEATADNEQVDGFSSVYEHLLNNAYMGYGSITQQQKDSALVIQAYVEPGKMKDYPEGFYLARINGKTAYFKDWDEEFVEHPLTKMDFVQAPGLYFPRSIAFDLCEIQKELCEYESIVKLHAKTSAVEPIVADENSKVSEITGRCDKVIWWRAFVPGVEAPHRMEHGELDPAIYAKIRELKGELENISHAVSVFRGEQPGSVTAASAIATLRGQAELQFAKPVNNWANGWKETTRKVIKNYQRYFTTVQLAEIVGSDKLTQIEDFKKANLDTCLEFVATASGLPKTRDEKRQEMMTLYDKQALDLNDPNVKQKVFELFGDTGMMKTFNADARRARMNMRRIRAGSPANFRPGIDDVSVHLGIALETAKNLDFEKWPSEAQQMLEQYIQQLRQAQSVEPPPPGGAPPVNKQGLPVQPEAPLPV